LTWRDGFRGGLGAAPAEAAAVQRDSGMTLACVGSFAFHLT
jgi:hypothetical protein